MLVVPFVWDKRILLVLGTAEGAFVKPASHLPKFKAFFKSPQPLLSSPRTVVRRQHSYASIAPEDRISVTTVLDQHLRKISFAHIITAVSLRTVRAY